MTGPLTIRCVVASDRFACASVALHFALRLGMRRDHAVQVSIAAAELASNAVRHAGGGTLVLVRTDCPRAGLELVCRDAGPGIDDVEAARRDGHSRGRDLKPDDVRDGLGSGLGAVARAMDELHVQTGPTGTSVTARKWLDPGAG